MQEPRNLAQYLAALCYRLCKYAAEPRNLAQYLAALCHRLCKYAAEPRNLAQYLAALCHRLCSVPGYLGHCTWYLVERIVVTLTVTLGQEDATYSNLTRDQD